MDRTQKQAVANLVARLVETDLDITKLVHSMDEDDSPHLYDAIVSMSNSIQTFKDQVTKEFGGARR